jgi:hypothetical protein
LIADQALKRLGAIAGLDSIGQPLPDECSATVLDLLKGCLGSAMDARRKQINTCRLFGLVVQGLTEYRVSPLILLVRDAMWSGEVGNCFVFGDTWTGVLTVISTAHLDPPQFETLVLHEVAHLFDAPSKHRKDTEQRYKEGGLHCDNYPKYACALTQVDVNDRPSVCDLTRMRLEQKRDYCPACAEDLRLLFSKQSD